MNCLDRHSDLLGALTTSCLAGQAQLDHRNRARRKATCTSWPIASTARGRSVSRLPACTVACTWQSMTSRSKHSRVPDTNKIYKFRERRMSKALTCCGGLEPGQNLTLVAIVPQLHSCCWGILPLWRLSISTVMESSMMIAGNFLSAIRPKSVPASAKGNRQPLHESADFCGSCNVDSSTFPSWPKIHRHLASSYHMDSGSWMLQKLLPHRAA